MKVLVSACLLGRPCRFDGGSKPSAAVLREVQGAELIPVCPVELAGLGTPRPAADLRGGDGHDVLEGRARVLRVEDGQDLTEAFLRGAELAARRCDQAILKARSPSCGVDRDGVFAALLRRRGVPLRTEEDL